VSTFGLVETLYLVASFLFILGLRGLTAAHTARRGLILAELGMVFAVAGTLMHPDISARFGEVGWYDTYKWILLTVFIGSAIGIAISALIPMTRMPERIALSHAFGGLAAALVGVSEYYREYGHIEHATMGAIGFEVLFGGLTFTGSLMAFGKLLGESGRRAFRIRCLSRRFHVTGTGNRRSVWRVGRLNGDAVPVLAARPRGRSVAVRERRGRVAGLRPARDGGCRQEACHVWREGEHGDDRQDAGRHRDGHR